MHALALPRQVWLKARPVPQPTRTDMGVESPHIGFLLDSPLTSQSEFLRPLAAPYHGRPHHSSQPNK